MSPCCTFKDQGLLDFAWNILYTTSASRWIDGYFAISVEWDADGDHTTANAMTETGVKFRANIAHSPFRFLTKFTDFWGVRFGVKNIGVLNWQRIGYTFEIGAGTW